MTLTLPHFGNRSNSFIAGRNPYEGYQRAWGLQFGTLRDQVRADPIYQEALAIAQDRTIVADDNRMNLFLIIRFFFPHIAARNIIEFGCWRGGNALFMAAVLRRLHPEARVYALDTFEGMPPTDTSIDLHNAGDFSGVDLDELRAFAKSHSLHNIEFVKGRFETTAAGVIARAGSFGLVHIDCDIYEAVRFCQNIGYTCACDRGYIAYDDACVSSCLGATQAVEEMIIERRIHSEQIWPHFVFRKAAQSAASS